MITYDLRTMQICEISQSTVVALGTFDGCHIGHLSVFSSCRSLARELGAKSAAFTFSSSPKDFFAKKPTPCLFSLDEKIKAIRQSGIDFLCIEDFSAVADMDGKDFLSSVLIGKLRAVGACCGFNFRFGKGASYGTAELDDFFKNRGGRVHICDKISFGNAPVSSSLIRSLVENGQVENILSVSRPYSIYAKVEHGKELGRTIGIPTINQKIPREKVSPLRGVYITECEIGEDVYPSVTNIGLRPTVENAEEENMETHIIGFDGNLYGSYVRVNFYKLIRNEKKFSSLDELKAEIDRNISEALEYFGASKK